MTAFCIAFYEFYLSTDGTLHCRFEGKFSFLCCSTFLFCFYLSIGRIDFVTLLSSDVNCQPGDGVCVGGGGGAQRKYKIQNKTFSNLLRVFSPFHLSKTSIIKSLTLQKSNSLILIITDGMLIIPLIDLQII